MKQYTTLLFDADMTLFDFDAAEERAFGIVMRSTGIQYSDADFERYKEINKRLWEQFGRGEITKEYLQSERFFRYLDAVSPGLYAHEDGERLNSMYIEALADCSQLLPGAADLCRKLCSRYDMYIVTNGISRTQKKRFAASELAPCFKGIFVSEDAGVPKPMRGYFDYVFARIGEERRSGSVIIGDSLSSDIQGGINAGIGTIWFNPKKAKTGDISPDYTVTSYDELLRLLD